MLHVFSRFSYIMVWLLGSWTLCKNRSVLYYISFNSFAEINFTLLILQGWPKEGTVILLFQFCAVHPRIVHCCKTDIYLYINSPKILMLMDKTRFNKYSVRFNLHLRSHKYTKWSYDPGLEGRNLWVALCRIHTGLTKGWIQYVFLHNATHRFLRSNVVLCLSCTNCNL